MAQLNADGWTAAQTRRQFAAIAWLRWRILRNGFRRKGGVGEMVGTALLSVLFMGMVLGFVAGAGFAAYFFVAKGHLAWIPWLLWGIFLVCQQAMRSICRRYIIHHCTTPSLSPAITLSTRWCCFL